MEFLVKSRSSGSEYTITVFDQGPNPVITCTCPAGANGQYCKHRFALIDGDDREVVESTHSVLDLAAVVAETPLAATIEYMREQERAVAAAQAELKRAKKKVAAAMRGQV